MCVTPIHAHLRRLWQSKQEKSTRLQTLIPIHKDCLLHLKQEFTQPSIKLTNLRETMKLMMLMMRCNQIVLLTEKKMNKMEMAPLPAARTPAATRKKDKKTLPRLNF